MLKRLQWLEFLSVEIQSAPSELPPDLSTGDLADLYVLSHTESLDASLITGDHTLEDLAELVNVPVMNVKQLKTLTAPTESTEPKEEVFPEIGINLHERSEIIDSISDLINFSATVPTPDSSRTASDDPDSILNGWANSGDVTTYIDEANRDTRYAKQSDLSVVGTIPVLDKLAGYIQDGKLTDAFRERLAENSSCPVSSDEFPQVQLTVPNEYVMTHATDDGGPEEFSRTLLALKQCQNIDYQTKSAFTADTNLGSDIPALSIDRDEQPDEQLISRWDYCAVALASSSEEMYLLTETSEEGLWKFKQLLGIEAMRL
jgi:hypothetical protein